MKLRAPILGLCALAACGPPANLQEPGALAAQNGDYCDATIYQTLVGEPIEVVDSLSTGLTMRVLGPDDFVTRDFEPNRLTFTTTPDLTVGRVFCG